MALDPISMVISKKHTDDTAISLGSLKGANCTIQSVVQNADGSTTVTFKWTGTDGTVQTQQMTVPKGVSVTGFTPIDDDTCVWDYSDGTQSSPFDIPEQIIRLSAATGNALVKNDDGYFVPSTGVKVSPDTENQIETRANGLFVDHDSTKINVAQGTANAGKALVVGADGNVTTGDAEVKRSSKTGNDITEVTDAGQEGIYVNIPVKAVAVDGTELTPDTDGKVDIVLDPATENQISYSAAGLLVGHDNTKIDIDQGISNAGKALVIGADGNVTTGDVGVKRSSKTGNDIQEITDVGEEGIYVSVPVKAVTIDSTDLTPDSTGKITVMIDSDTDNQISYGANGFFVGHDSEKIDVDQTVANAGKALVVGADGMVTTGDAGVKRSSKSGNSIAEITDAGEEGIYVPPIPKRSTKDGNAIVELTDEGEEGLYVETVSSYTGEEVDKTKIPTLAAMDDLLGLTVKIDDTTSATTSVWSSSKVSKEIGLLEDKDSVLTLETYAGGIIVNEIEITGAASSAYGSQFKITISEENEDGSKTNSIDVIVPKELSVGDKIVQKDGLWVVEYANSDPDEELVDPSALYTLIAYDSMTKISCSGAEISVSYGSSAIASACIDASRVANFTMYALSNFERYLLSL